MKKIAVFGDSIARSFFNKLNENLTNNYSHENYELHNFGVSGETTSDGLKRIAEVVEYKPHTVLIEFGMNDLRKVESEKEFCQNYEKIVDTFMQNKDLRVILLTINPAINLEDKVSRYNELIRNIAQKKALKLADIEVLWKDRIKNTSDALRDDLHPNQKGISIFVEILTHAITREYTVLLWQYNTREAKCNYRCPYCYYIGLHNPKDKFFGTIEQWKEAFYSSFGNQKLIFYLAFGEPSIGSKFYDIVEMIGNEPNWQLRMTSNVSQNFEKLVNSKVAKDNRLFINASYHPLAVDRQEFLDNILFLREHGIEVPIIYVTYPLFLERLEDDIDFFSNKNKFVVHVRRFQGWYKGKEYPYAFSDEDRRLIAKYSDDNMIKYMLNQQHNAGHLSYSGVNFFIIDNVGNVGYDSNVFHPYTKYRCIFGNIFQDNFKPLSSPGPYPGRREGTVDGVANLVETNMQELRDNNVLSFARQGGVFKNALGTVLYKNLYTDFEDSKIRAEYNFPPRNEKDRKALAQYNKNVYDDYVRNKRKNSVKAYFNRHPKLKEFIKNLLGKKLIEKLK